MSTLPKISIITPSYNQGQYIEQTITSVLDQGYSNLEYILIDGGSTDNTLEVIKKYENHLTYWVSEEDNGQSSAINKGFRKATGEIINWLNSDDYYEPGSLAHVAEVFDRPDINVYCGISRSFGIEAENFSKGTDVYSSNLAKTIGWARIDQPETFFRKASLDKIGYVNENLHYTMDKDLWIRYLCYFGLNNIVKDEKLIVHFRLHHNSKTISLKEQFSKETINLFYNYALRNSLEDYVQTFNRLFQTKEIDLQYFPEMISLVGWDSIFSYFLFGQGLEAYATNDFLLAKKIFSHLQVEFLNVEDRKHLHKINFRLKYLPVQIKQLWNNFTQ